MRKIRHQILDHIHMRQRRDANFALQIGNGGGAGKAIRAVQIHRARAANPFPAGAAEGKRGIDLVLDLEQGVQHHRAAFVQIDFERVVTRVLAAVGIITVNLEFFDAARSTFATLYLMNFAVLADLAVRGERESGHEKIYPASECDIYLARMARETSRAKDGVWESGVPAYCTFSAAEGRLIRIFAVRALMTIRKAVIFGASGGIGAALALRLAEAGVQVMAGARSGEVPAHADITPFRFDLAEEASIADAAKVMADDPPDLVIIATGVLTLADETGPERSFKALDGTAMAEVLMLNTIGPALVAKHMLPLMPRKGRSVFAALSARVGSISDNGIGGWHSYRASKAALNMLIRNFAIELGRTHKEAVVLGLHPGTVDSALSEPFQKNLPDGQLTTPEDAARNLLGVIEGARVKDSGSVLDWKGERVPA